MLERWIKELNHDAQHARVFLQKLVALCFLASHPDHDVKIEKLVKEFMAKANGSRQEMTPRLPGTSASIGGQQNALKKVAAKVAAGQ